MMAGFGNPFPGQPKKWGDTTSKAGEVSRIFVGRIDFDGTSCEEIEQRFGQYGNIQGIDLNQKNFAFIQYSTVEEAQAACAGENGSFFKNRKIEVRLFDKSGHPTKSNKSGPPPMHIRDRSRSPTRVGGGRPMGGPTGTRHGSVIPQMNQYDDPYAYGGPPPPPVPNEPVIGNEAEIIVINRDQWPYAEMIEKRIKAETGLSYIDMLFLHSPSSLNMTLNDLYERQTYYALVVAPVNEEHRSVTLHVLHNQTEHRNMPLEDAILLINKDFQAVTGRAGPPPPSIAQTGPVSADKKLPDEVAYLLRSILAEGGTKFMSLTQVDLLIDYFQKERTKHTVQPPSATPPAPMNSYSTSNSYANANSVAPVSAPGAQPEFEKQRTALLDNPHVKAAISSLMQIGALSGSNNSSNASAATSQTNNGMAVSSNPYAAQPQPANNSPARRHPLLGTEVPRNNSTASASMMSIPGAPGGLVRYPLPQTYNQYSTTGYQF